MGEIPDFINFLFYISLCCSPSLYTLGFGAYLCESWDLVFSSQLRNLLLQGIKEGWYDGGSIAFAVILVIVVTGIIFCLCKVYNAYSFCLHVYDSLSQYPIWYVAFGEVTKFMIHIIFYWGGGYYNNYTSSNFSFEVLITCFCFSLLCSYKWL